MKVRLLVGFSGPHGSWQPGELYECDAAEGGRFIEAGYAEAVAQPIERAVKPAAKVKRTKA